MGFQPSYWGHLTKFELGESYVIVPQFPHMQTKGEITALHLLGLFGDLKTVLNNRL